jgi:UDP-glucose 4-epimerase
LLTILVTGGAGYIGSHTCVELLEAGYQVVVVDNLCNASREALNRVEVITCNSVAFHEVDVRDAEGLRGVFGAHKIDAVIHFAGLKAVGESVEFPERYVDNNVHGTQVLCEVMAECGVKNLVFSSSASVYGFPSDKPIAEDAPTQPAQPYGETKLAVEKHLAELCAADKQWDAISLRYFNPVGAHESGMIGEDPSGTPNNLTPFITQVAIGKRELLQVWGDDWPTTDGTGVRDYIHVVDLAKGHVKALEKLREHPGELILNLGTGRPCSVLEVLAAFEKAVGRDIPYEIKGRREGDIAIYFADPTLAIQLLGWQADLDIDAMARDAWRWQEMNPNGYSH